LTASVWSVSFQWGADERLFIRTSARWYHGSREVLRSLDRVVEIGESVIARKKPGTGAVDRVMEAAAQIEARVTR
jgi:hypothetical protein